MELTLTLSILIFVVIYHIDQFSAVLLRKFKPNVFNKVEGNEMFRNFLNSFPLWKALIIYDVTVSLQLILMYIAASLLGFYLLFGEITGKSLAFAFLFMAMIHLFCAGTNLIGFLKEEKPLQAPGQVQVQNQAILEEKK